MNWGCPYHCVPLPAAPVELRWPEAHTPHGNDEKLYGKYSYIGATRRISCVPNIVNCNNRTGPISIANVPKAASVARGRDAKVKSVRFNSYEKMPVDNDWWVYLNFQPVWDFANIACASTCTFLRQSVWETRTWQWSRDPEICAGPPLGHAWMLDRHCNACVNIFMYCCEGCKNVQ